MRRFAVFPVVAGLVLSAFLSICACTEDSSTPIRPCDEEPTKPDVVYFHPAEYPDEAVVLGLEGTVIVKVLVGVDGEAVQAEILQGSSEILNQAALEAAMQCTFTPGRMNCQTIEAWIALPYIFEAPL